MLRTSHCHPWGKSGPDISRSIAVLDVPTAIMSNLRGRTILTTLSVYLNTSNIISSSVAGGGLSSGCEHGWTMPFMSRYKLSNSSPFGFFPRMSRGMSCPSISCGFSSWTCEMILGYFCESHRNSAGTPIFGSRPSDLPDGRGWSDQGNPRAKQRRIDCANRVVWKCLRFRFLRIQRTGPIPSESVRRWSQGRLSVSMTSRSRA